MSSKTIAVVATAVHAALAFQPTPSFRSSTTTTALGMVAVDPTTVTKKEYQDICGVSFDENGLAQRLHATNFLYPKHVEVIEDIAPIADAMVDDIVSHIVILRALGRVRLELVTFLLILSLFFSHAAFLSSNVVYCSSSKQATRLGNRRTFFQT